MTKQKNEISPTCCAGLTQQLQPEFFKALCDPTRLAILAYLATRPGPLRVSEVGQCCPIDLSVVSRHLTILRQAGIVRSEKRGKEVFYQVQFTPFIRTLRGIADALEACCPPDPKQGKEPDHA